MKDHVQKLKKLLKNSIVTGRPADLAAYRDIGYPSSNVGIVVRPDDYGDIQILLEYCNTHSISLSPWGGGTNLCGALSPSRPFIALDMKSLNSILDYSPENGYITVQSGASIVSVSRYLEDRDHIFPHDPWSLRSATIGGAISLDSAGNLYPKHGSVRDQILSLKVMLADGRIIDVGRNLSKTSATPFLPGLFIGAEGHFGIILEATFSIHRRPETFATLGFAFSDFDWLFAAAQALKAAGIEPQSYIGGTVPSRVEKLQPKAERVLVKLLNINSALFLYYDGLQGEVEARKKKAVEILSGLGRKMPDKYSVEWWDERYTYFEMSPELADEGIYVHVFDLCVPPSKIPNLSHQVVEVAKSLGISDRLSHTLFCGVDAYTVALYVDDIEEGRELVRKCEELVLPLVQEAGGSITRTHGLGTLFSDEIALNEMGEDGLFLLQSLKRSLDPNGILNPGILHRGSEVGRSGKSEGEGCIDIDTELIRKCLSSECSSCRENCPSYIGFQLDSYSSRGKNRALMAYLKGELQLDDIKELIYACTTCGQCAEVCLTGGSFYDQVLALREQLECRGEESPGLKEMVTYIRDHSTPYPSKDTTWMSDDNDSITSASSGKGRGKVPGRGKIGYFPGCTIQSEYPEFARRTVNLLRTLGTDPIPISEPCCGFPVVNAGFTDEAKAMSREFLKEVREIGIKTIVTSCAGCTAMLRIQLPRLTKEKVKVLHITEFLAAREKQVSKLFGKVGYGKTVLYHDPCDLARKLGIIEEPRIVIRSLGFKLMEFSDNRTETACCGGGGGFFREYPDHAKTVPTVRINEATDRGVETIVTACLSCRRMLRSVASEGCTVLDVIELFPEEP